MVVCAVELVTYFDTMFAIFKKFISFLHGSYELSARFSLKGFVHFISFLLLSLYVFNFFFFFFLDSFLFSFALCSCVALFPFPCFHSLVFIPSLYFNTFYDLSFPLNQLLYFSPAEYFLLVEFKQHFLPICSFSSCSSPLSALFLISAICGCPNTATTAPLFH